MPKKETPKLTPKLLIERHAGEPVTKPVSFAVNGDVIEALEGFAPVYGSLGRALQVGTEVLVRQKRPLKVDGLGDPEMRRTFKLLPRTIELIHTLAPVYGDAAKVIAACVKVLKADPQK